MSRPNAFVLMCVAVLASAGCATHAQKWPSDARPVFAQSIHVYPGATLESAMGGDYLGDEGQQVSETLSWFFECSADKDKMVEWYAKKLPAATRSEGDEGETIFTFTPEGAEQGEEIVVRINDQKIQITEETKPGKHRDA